MILIKETTPVKSSGITCLHVSFPFSQDIVDTIKQFYPAIWLAKEKCWEISSVYLAKLLDALTFKDDIKLELNEISEVSKFKNEASNNLTETEIKQFNFTPFAHQIDAINYGLNKNKWLLLDGCGLGKTLEIIGLAETLKRRGLANHCLIICGVNSLKLNWEKEIKKYSTESCRVLGKRVSKTGTVSYTSIKERAQELLNPIDEFFVITNVESFRYDEIVDAVNKSNNKFEFIAIDEIHKCLSNSSSEQGNNLLKLKADYKVGASGTLVVNSAMSVFGGLKFTENDNSTLTNFRNLYCEYGGIGGHQIVGFRNLNLLQNELDSCSVRRTLDQVKSDIPKLQIDFETLEMDKDHAEFYSAIKQGIKEEATKVELKGNNLLALTTRLRQASVCPSILTDKDITPSKLLRCKEIVDEIVGQGEKVVVFGTFKEPLEQLASMLRASNYKVSINTGDYDDAEISKNVDKFQKTDEIQVFLATSAKMGVGHTLNASMYLLFLDLPWTWSDFDQCYSRVYRVTNTRPAYIKVLGCANTIDEKVWEIISRKKDLGDYLVDGKVSSTFEDDLKEIIFC